MSPKLNTVLCLPQYHPIHQQGRADCQTAIAICVLQYFRRLQKVLSNGQGLDPAVSERVRHFLEKSEVKCPGEFRDRFLSHHHRTFSPNDPLPMNVFGRLVSPLQFSWRRHGEHTGFPPSAAAIQSEIENGRPLILILKSLEVNRLLHFVSLVGWLKKGVAHDTEDVAIIHDPLKDTRKECSVDEANLSRQIVQAAGESHEKVQAWLDGFPKSLRLIPHSVLDAGSKVGAAASNEESRQFPWRWTATLTFKDSFQRTIGCGQSAYREQNADDGSGWPTVDNGEATPANSKDNLAPAVAAVQKATSNYEATDDSLGLVPSPPPSRLKKIPSPRLAALLWKDLEWHERTNHALLHKGVNGKPGWKRHVEILEVPVVTTLVMEATFKSEGKANTWAEWLSAAADLRWQSGNRLFMGFPWLRSGDQRNASPYAFRLSQSKTTANNSSPQVQRSMFVFGFADFLLRNERLQSTSLIVMHAKTGSHLLLSCPAAQPMPLRARHDQVQQWCLENTHQMWEVRFVEPRQTRPKSIPRPSDFPEQFQRFYKLLPASGRDSNGLSWLTR